MAEIRSPSDLLALSPEEFERLVAALFTSLGFDVKRIGAPGDEGVDLRLTKGGELTIAQCKRYRGTVGQSQVRDFYGAMQHENAPRGYIVTSGMFSLAATTWAEGKQIALVDGGDLVAAIKNVSLPTNVPSTSARVVATSADQLLSAVIAGIRDYKRLGRILIDGPPPKGKTFQELAEYLRRRLRLKEPGIKWIEGKRRQPGDLYQFLEDGVRIVFVNEFDAATRDFMEEALRPTFLVERPVSRSSGDGVAEEEFADEEVEEDFVFEEEGKRYVLVATRWEKRIPVRMAAEFSVILDPLNVEWERVPTFEQWAARDEEAAAVAAHRARQGAKRQEEEATRQREIEAIRRESARQERTARLESMWGLYCAPCQEWHPEESSESDCPSCGRMLRFNYKTLKDAGHYQTRHRGIFGTSWETSEREEVAAAKKRRIEHEMEPQQDPDKTE